jgi:hypothetical protein
MSDAFWNFGTWNYRDDAIIEKDARESELSIASYAHMYGDLFARFSFSFNLKNCASLTEKSQE